MKFVVLLIALAMSVVALCQDDVTTPLHALKADYKVSYGAPSAESVIAALDRVYGYVERSTPMGGQGKFRLMSYEWGVTYSAMLNASERTGDRKYYRYAVDRMQYIANRAHELRALRDSVGTVDVTYRQMLEPRALDDCGAVCAAMIKAQLGDKRLNLREQIDVYINHVAYGQYRLDNGMLARTRPYYNSVWLDDMYMGIPALAYHSKLTTERKSLNDAYRQVRLYRERMFVEETGLFVHGWVEGMEPHPRFYWARANGWAMLALSEFLDASGAHDEGYAYALDLFRRHAKSIASLQGVDGFWHQLLDRSETYEETSATALFTYCLAHGINKGWLDEKAYGPVALAGWNAVESKIDDEGKVHGTCVGTGMAFDASFYAYRPVSTAAAHGYGPAILAGSEVFALLFNQNPTINDSAVQFYSQTGPQASASSITYDIADPDKPIPLIPGESRREGRPVVFIIGDSTVKNGQGLGDGDMWGWGSLFGWFVDTAKVSVENHALGGRSSRTFITQGLWSPVRDAIRPGDYLIVQFGHNDGGSLNTGRARASLDGSDERFEDVVLESNGGPERVYTFGHYMRQYIREAKAMGAKVIVLSHTPKNRWTDGKVARCTATYAQWSKDAAEAEGATYIDHNALVADVLDAAGEGSKLEFFKDGVHTVLGGAIVNCKTLAKAIIDSGIDLGSAINREALEREYGYAGQPVYSDPVCDGAADPVIVRNVEKGCLTMFYTNRRANVEGLNGVEWVHGTKIGMAESYDHGNTWKYVGTADIQYGDEGTTFWAPDVVREGGLYHMYLTIVPGIFKDWQHPRTIAHFTSRDLASWKFEKEIELSSKKVIDAGLIKVGKTWHMFYNNEKAGKTIFRAESEDLYNWRDCGQALAFRGEGPKVFAWKGRYFMIVDEWKGLAVFSSFDLKTWIKQPKNILVTGGTGMDDGVKGGHCDVVVEGEKAYIYYFVHPGKTAGVSVDDYSTRRSVIQVAELKFKNGVVSCERDRVRKQLLVEY